jgi:folate-binding protein YgfZ
VTAPTLEQQAQALDAGRGYAELDDVSLTLVSGEDARAWLHDLATTDVESLGRFQTRPSLLLSPTGRIRASFHVLGLGERDLLLAQPTDQPTSIAQLLAPYLLSSAVTLGPSSLRVFAVPSPTEPPRWAGEAWRPSVLGDGFDLLVDAGKDGALEDVRARLAAEGLVPVGREAREWRRVHRGEPRFPADLDVESLPAEAGWDRPPVTDRTKGCFLGQEAVAKVANLGHPTRVVVGVVADAPMQAGDVLVGDGVPVGSLSSAAGGRAIARVTWAARDHRLATAAGVDVRRR